jgi:pimeloyl-ACP methyl ester carboxylesterase
LFQYVAVCAALTGCQANIGVREAAHPDLFADWKASAFDAGQPSPRTVQTLRSLNLADFRDEHLDVAQARLQAIALRDPQDDYLFALAEINFLLGRRTERAQDPQAVAHYYLCAGYAYHFLFDRPPGPNPFDPRHRLACDLYNAGLSKCIRFAQEVGQLDPRRQLVVPTRQGDFALTVSHHGFAWRPEEFGPLLFCADYEVLGLANHYRTFGLGVPLIGIRGPSANLAPGHAYYPKEVSFPVTAFFRFEGSLADLSAGRAGRLELYDPLHIQSVQVHGQPVALETDLTTPLAYFLSKTDLEGVALRGFFHADRLRDKSGLYLFEPYQPGKIPVVLTHGLLSSPLTWTTMYNDLRADPVLRENYQFWFFLYPTANPYLATAADLRQSLTLLRHDLDPHGKDPALREMVLVGHSMGGLVNKMLTQESGEEFWTLVSAQPFYHVKGSPQTLNELSRVFYFDRDSGVRRVIFIGTPHRGSRLSEPTAFVLDRFLKMPRGLMDAARDVARQNPDLWPALAKDPDEARFATSLDLLTPGAPALQLLAGRAAPTGVHFHSIIGVSHGEGMQANDGIVPYASAHIDGVDSELLVPASHSALHDHPQSILEVRRILRQHLEEARQREIIQVGGQ